MDQFVSKAVDVNTTVTIAARLREERRGLKIQYAGPSSTFAIEELSIDGEPCFAGPEPLTADGLVVNWPGHVRRGAIVVLRVRNGGSGPATFVALITDLGG
jgi:hypothetical protein